MVASITENIISFAQYIDCGTFGNNLYYGRVPVSQKTPTEVWLLTNTSAVATTHNTTGEDTFEYTYSIMYRNMSLEAVDKEILRITKAITNNHCYNLPNYKTINLEVIDASPVTGVDEENRVYGSVNFRVTIYNL